MDAKYFVAFDVPEHAREKVCKIADRVATVTWIDPSQNHPHITVVPPFVWFVRNDEGVLRALLTNAARKMRRTRVVISGLDIFENTDAPYFVLPVHVPYTATEFYQGVSDLLKNLPKSLDERSFHITVGKGGSPNRTLDDIRVPIRGITFERIEFCLTELTLYAKPSEKNGKWQKIATFPFPT